uniref:Uncharacterized protein n=1 Tax=Hordeum vulgare subsp. vulgare TaxID=112509 RepID=A0A8I6WLQ6_HORVV
MDRDLVYICFLVCHFNSLKLNSLVSIGAFGLRLQHTGRTDGSGASQIIGSQSNASIALVNDQKFGGACQCSKQNRPRIHIPEKANME